MKVLIVGPISSPIIRRLQYSLRNDGYDVLVASHNAKGIEGTVDLGELRSFFDYLNFFKIRKLVEIYNPDVVHAHVLNHYGLMCLFQSRPLVVALWGSDVLIAPSSGGLLRRYIFKLINRAVLKKATRLHTSASHVAEEANRQCSGVIEKTDVFYWGFPLRKPNDSVLKEIERKFECEFSLGGRGYIIFPRGLASIYNPRVASEIIKAMLGAEIKHKIIVLQGFATAENVEEFVRSVDISKITLIDRLLDEDELYYLYDRCDIHFSIPVSDSLGGGVVEPSLLGSFPVLSNLPSYSKYLAKNNGYMMRNYAKDSLDELIVKIKSGEFRKSSHNAPSAEYGLSSVLSSLKSTYTKAVSEKH